MLTGWSATRDENNRWHITLTLAKRGPYVEYFDPTEDQAAGKRPMRIQVYERMTLMQTLRLLWLLLRSEPQPIIEKNPHAKIQK